MRRQAPLSPMHTSSRFDAIDCIAGRSDRMDLKRWSHIVAVAERRSFARAAELVHLSQPAFSRSIQAAEAELGLRLFDRGPAGRRRRRRRASSSSSGRAGWCSTAAASSATSSSTPIAPSATRPSASGRFRQRPSCRALLAGVRRDFPAIGVARRGEQLAAPAAAAARGGHRVLRRRYAATFPPTPTCKVRPLRPRAGRLLRARRSCAGAASLGHARSRSGPTAWPRCGCRRRCERRWPGCSASLRRPSSHSRSSATTSRC